MFDISIYNYTVLFSVFFISVLILLLVYWKVITSLLDPLVMHIFWISGNISFLMGYIHKYGLSFLPLFFFLLFLLYIYFNRLFLNNSRSRDANVQIIVKLLFKRQVKVKLAFCIVASLFFLSKWDFFTYALTHPSLSDWVLYRFVDLQGRNPLFRIFGTGSEVFFYLYSFALIFILKTWRKRAVLLILSAVLLGIFAGGRSSMLASLIALGAFIFYFNSHISKSLIKRINVLGGGLVAISLFVAVIISSMYSEDDSLSDGFFIILNRFLAVGDGLQYYMDYDGINVIASGVSSYLTSVFGVYIHPFTGVKYVNVGTQLSNLVYGYELPFAQGANYTFPLQVMVFNPYLFLLYLLFISFTVSKFRNNSFRRLTVLPISYFFSFHCFTIATDIEYAVLCLISGTIVYVVFLYPLWKIKLQ